MDLELTPEQRELRTVAAELLNKRVGPATARRFSHGPGDTGPLWDELGTLGWYGVGIDADDPFGVPGLCLIAEELGRHLAPTLVVDVAVIARIIAAGGDEPVRMAWLDRLQDGAVPTALALLERGGTWRPELLEAVAVADGHGGFRVDAAKLAVRHGAQAAAFGVVALLDGEPALFLVPADAAGVEVEAIEPVDATGRPARVTLDDVHVGAEQAVVGVGARAAIERALDIGAVATAAEAVGAAWQALDDALRYAREREQFGRPIGRFQAVQHLLADAHVLRETAWSSCFYAAAALDEDAPDAREAAAVAKAHASRAAREVVQLALQVLAGVGFTAEHDLHLYLRRVLDCERRFGDAVHHEEHVVAALAERVEAAHLTGTGR